MTSANKLGAHVWRIVSISCAVAGMALCTGMGAATDYPSKPIRIIVPIAPGGGQDFIARLVGQKLSTAVGHSVVIDNRPGAGGNLGAELAARSLPDGYTLVVVAASFTIQPSLYAKMSYDPVKDFAPVMQLGGQGYALVVLPSLSAKTLKEFIALAKSSKTGVTYASSGNGELSHLGMELLTMRGEFNAVHVPYKGTQPALVAVMSKQVDTYFSSIGATLPLIANGKIRALAVTTPARCQSWQTFRPSPNPGFPAMRSTAGTDCSRPQKPRRRSSRSFIGRFSRYSNLRTSGRSWQ